jgi:hypothetical protein
MAFRTRRSEYEADLYKVPTPWLFRREMGELERTSYEDGEERLKISFRGVDAPDGACVEVLIDGAAIAQVGVERGRGRLVLSSSEGAEVPEVKTGQEVEIRLLGQPVLAGVFKPD